MKTMIEIEMVCWYRFNLVQSKLFKELAEETIGCFFCLDLNRRRNECFFLVGVDAQSKSGWSIIKLSVSIFCTEKKKRLNKKKFIYEFFSFLNLIEINF